MRDVMDNDGMEGTRQVATLQRLRARVARRPGKWRRRMARSRTSPSPSTGWAARSRGDRDQARGLLDEVA